MSSWVFCSIGTLFCAGGIYLFYRNSLEENKPVRLPVLLMMAGLVLIGIGTAKYFNV